MKIQNLLYLILTCTAPVVYATVPAVNSNTLTLPDKSKVTTAIANISVPFEENRGQSDAKVAFQAKTLAGPLFVTKTGELVWSLTNYPPHSPLDRREVKSYSVVERFVGGQLNPVGAMPAVTRVSYVRGNDPAKWQRNVTTWQQVSLGQVWPGISVDVAAHGKNAEKIFTLAPGAEVKAITVAVEGGVLQLEANGNLRVSNAQQPLVSFSTPVAWQEINGQRHPVQVAYRVADAGKYGFTLGAYDAKHAVMIDPVVQSTYLGGAGLEEVNAVAATAFGIYVAGTTASTDFPSTTGGYVASNTDTDTDTFVARLATDLKTITQATYLGGTGDDEALAMAVTTNGVYIAGTTSSTNLAGAKAATGVGDGVQKDLSGTTDAFVTMLGLELIPPVSSDPTDLQSTYFGGTGEDAAKALAVNHTGVFIAGNTTSTDLTPVTSPFKVTMQPS